jgi:hypothetical protein
LSQYNSTEAASLKASASIFSEYSENLAFEMLQREQIHQKHVLLITQKM